MNFLEFEGSNCFRQRLILATLVSKKIVIQKFRDTIGSAYGIQNFELNLLKLFEKITNGSSIFIDRKGTKITYKPGILYGGNVEHFCGLERSISYYLEALLPLSVFCKFPLEINLTGITNDQDDPSVDSLRQSSLPLMKLFLGDVDDQKLQIKLVSRGMKPEGGGHVFFTAPIRRVIKPVQLISSGKVKRIRGIAFATRVSPQIANRMVHTAKGILLNFIPDIYIYTDHLKGKNSGKSPGFGLSLVAETNQGVFFVGEAISEQAGSENGVSTPEDIAKKAVSDLLNDIYRGGSISTINQGLAILFMSFTERDLSKILLGPLSPYTIQLLRHLKLFTSLTFKLDSYDSINEKKLDNENLKNGSKKIVAACFGLGYSNISKTFR